MSVLKVKYVCPFGLECEDIIEKDGEKYIQRCVQYIEIAGTNPQTGEKENGWKCSIAWQPILSLENIKVSSGVQAAIESLRNEMVKGQHEFTALITNTTKKGQLI